MDRVEQLLDARLNDTSFVAQLKSLPSMELRDALDAVMAVCEECEGKISGSISRFRDPGIPADPEWFTKCKKLLNIRKKHTLMIEREIHLRH